jgi:hypothetical protein
MITHGIRPLLTNAKCVILNVMDSIFKYKISHEKKIYF